MHRTEGAAPTADELAILRLINRWIVYRDSGDWVRLRAVWHEDGTMTAGWKQGPADDFIAACKVIFEGTQNVVHELGATEIVVRDDRAISQSKMTITTRGDLDGVLCDVTCMGRHLDRWQKREGLWGLLARQTIYDRDRVDPVVPGERPQLDHALLTSYGEAYRHLAYFLAERGFEVSRKHPALKTPEGDALLSEWRAWVVAA